MCVWRSKPRFGTVYASFPLFPMARYRLRFGRCLIRRRGRPSRSLAQRILHARLQRRFWHAWSDRPWNSSNGSRRKLRTKTSVNSLREFARAVVNIDCSQLGTIYFLSRPTIRRSWLANMMTSAASSGLVGTKRWPVEFL